MPFQSTRNTVSGALSSLTSAKVIFLVSENISQMLFGNMVLSVKLKDESRNVSVIIPSQMEV